MKHMNNKKYQTNIIKAMKMLADKGYLFIGQTVIYGGSPMFGSLKKVPMKQRIEFPVAIVDACDIGVWIVGRSEGVNDKLLLSALKDNPLGQTDQQTPMGILREVKNENI